MLGPAQKESERLRQALRAVADTADADALRVELEWLTAVLADSVDSGAVEAAGVRLAAVRHFLDHLDAVRTELLDLSELLALANDSHDDALSAECHAQLDMLGAQIDELREHLPFDHQERAAILMVDAITDGDEACHWADAAAEVHQMGWSDGAPSGDLSRPRHRDWHPIGVDEDRWYGRLRTARRRTDQPIRTCSTESIGLPVR
jgi:hypothetical protein